MLVKAFKLVSGEEIVGEVLAEEEQTLVVKNPLAVMIRQHQNGELGVGFVPFAPYLGKDATIEFARDKIVFVCEVDNQMRNQYSSIFGGIVTPPKTLLVG